MKNGLSLMSAGLASMIVGVALVAGIAPAMVIGGFVAFLGGLFWFIDTQ